MYANNSPEWLLLELGAGLAGLVLVTINPAGRARELDFVLRQSRSVGLFHADAFRGNPLAEWVAQVQGSLPGLREVVPLGRWAGFVDVASGPRALPGVQPGDAAQMQYTSGTTGSPKGALLHHRGLTNNARFFMQRAELRAGDVFVHALPFFHTDGLRPGGARRAAGAGHPGLPAGLRRRPPARDDGARARHARDLACRR